MEFSEDTLFEGVTVKRGDEDGPPIGEVLIYEQAGQIGVVLPTGTLIRGAEWDEGLAPPIPPR